MKTKLFYFFLFLRLGAWCQELSISMHNGGSLNIDRRLIVYGIKKQGSGAKLCVYEITATLLVKDSAIFDLQNSRSHDYLDLSSDTLHGFLHIYLQRKNENRVRIFRLTKDLQKQNEIPEVEVGRLNNLQLFSKSPFYFHDLVYDIHIRSDSGQIQFFLNKFRLKDKKGNFEYEPAWQWAFEKKDMEWARIIHADKRFVYLFASRSSNTKSIQWVLKINAVTGTLVKAVKLNSKDEEMIYHFASCVQTPQKELLIIGQKLTGKTQSDCAARELLFYLAALDSTAEISLKSTITMPVQKPRNPTLKCQAQFLQWKNIKMSGKNIYADADLYQAAPDRSCYFLNNTFTIALVRTEEEIRADNFKAGNASLEPLYNLADKTDLNGKICTGETAPEERFSATPLLPIKSGFKTDSLGNGIWLLKKNETRKKNVQFSFYRPEKKIYQNKVIENIPHTFNPHLIMLDKEKFVIVRQPAEDKVLIKLYNW